MARGRGPAATWGGAALGEPWLELRSVSECVSDRTCWWQERQVGGGDEASGIRAALVWETGQKLVPRTDLGVGAVWRVGAQESHRPSGPR